MTPPGPVERPQYSRVYWSVLDDPKFDGIRVDVRHLGAWTLLLIVADIAWPTTTFVPPAVPKTSLKALVDCGLIDALPDGRFRVHGLDAEREQRAKKASDAGKASALARQQKKPTGAQPKVNTRSTLVEHPLNTSSTLVPENEHPLNTSSTRAQLQVNKDEDEDEDENENETGGLRAPAPARAGPTDDDEPEWPVLAWLASVKATIPPSGNGYHIQIIQLVERQGAAKVIAAMKVRYAAGEKSPRQLIYGAANDLEPIGRGAKPLTEEQRHRAEFDARLAAARKETS